MPERFSASVAARHISCHGSADLEKAIPNFVHGPIDDTKGAAIKGTERHVVIEEMNKETVTDMQHMIDLFQYIVDLRRTRRFNVLTEHQVTSDWLPKPQKSTLDLCLYTQDEIHVLDPKTGKIPVEVNELPWFFSIRVLLPMIYVAVFFFMEGVAAPVGVVAGMILGLNLAI